MQPPDFLVDSLPGQHASARRRGAWEGVDKDRSYLLPREDGASSEEQVSGTPIDIVCVVISFPGTTASLALAVTAACHAEHRRAWFTAII
jgi:hypothetical protein